MKNLTMEKVLLIILVLIISLSKGFSQTYVCPGDQLTKTAIPVDQYHYLQVTSVSGGTVSGGNRSPSFTITWDATSTGNVTWLNIFQATPYPGAAVYSTTINVIKILDEVNSVTFAGAPTAKLLANSTYSVSASVTGNPTITSWSVTKPDGTLVQSLPITGTSFNFKPSSYNSLKPYIGIVDNLVMKVVSNNGCGDKIIKKPFTIQLDSPSASDDNTSTITSTCQSSNDAKLEINSITIDNVIYNNTKNIAEKIRVSVYKSAILIGEAVDFSKESSFPLIYNSNLPKSSSYEYHIERFFGADPSGITLKKNFTVAAGPELILQLDASSPDCNYSDVTVTLTPSINRTYDYLMGSQTLSGNSAIVNLTQTNSLTQLYNFSIQDQNSTCSASKDISITYPKAITNNSSITTDINCYNSTAIITASGLDGTGILGYTISGTDWSGNNPYICKSGIYNLRVTDSKGCFTDKEISITNPPPITISGTPDTTEPTKCSTSDGSITLTALGGTLSTGGDYNYLLLENNDEYKLKNGEPCTFPDLPGGTYNIKITDENLCSDTFEIEVPLPDNNLSATTNNIISSKCNEANGSATVLVTGGTSPFTYFWNNGETTATANELTEDLHTVTVTDAKDCKTETTVTIAGTLVPQISSINATPALCSYSEGGGSLTASFTNTEAGDYTLEWYNANNESVTPNDLAPGFYSVTLTDFIGCVYPFYSLEVTAPDELRANLIAYERPVCDNDNTGVLTVEAVGGTPNYTLNWIDFPDLGNTNTISNLYAGTYQLEITDSNNCVSNIQSFDLFNTDNINFDIVDSVFLCQGQSATIDAGNPGSVYDWTSNNGFSATSQSVVLQNEGDYSVTVTNENGCTGQKEFHVKYDDRLFEVAFLISTESTIEDTLVLIEISWPIPDSVQWIIPNEFTRLVDGVSYKELIPSQTGDYTIGMKAFLGGCSGIVEKQITILAADSTLALKDFSQVLIRKVNLFPNPNNGIFEIDIELATETNIQVDLYSMDGMRMQAPRIEKGLKNYNVKYNLMSLEPGFYFINVIAGKEVRKLKFIVN